MAVPGDTIRALDGRGSTRATAVSARDGSFTMAIGPGAFTLVEDICGVRQNVDPQRGETVVVVLVLPDGC